MSLRSRLCSLLVVTVLAAALPAPAHGQLIKNLKKAVRDAVTEEVADRADALVGDYVTSAVDDGRFVALLTPWVAEDGSESVGRANLSGAAVFARGPTGFVVAFCDEAEPKNLIGTFIVPAVDSAGRPVAVAAAAASRRSTRPAPGEPTPAEATEPASSPVGEYETGTGGVKAAVVSPRLSMIYAANGTLRLESATDELWVGTIRVTLPGVRIAEEEPRDVHAMVAFRAVPPTAENAGSCQATRTTTPAVR